MSRTPLTLARRRSAVNRRRRRNKTRVRTRESYPLSPTNRRRQGSIKKKGKKTKGKKKMKSGMKRKVTRKIHSKLSGGMVRKRYSWNDLKAPIKLFELFEETQDRQYLEEGGDLMSDIEEDMRRTTPQNPENDSPTYSQLVEYFDLDQGQQTALAMLKRPLTLYTANPPRVIDDILIEGVDDLIDIYDTIAEQLDLFVQQHTATQNAAPINAET